MDTLTKKPWIGCDLDGTLAYHANGAFDPEHIGLPIQPMLERVRGWLAAGKLVKIVTARAVDKKAVKAIRDWLDGIGLHDVGITDTITEQTEEIWSSIAVGVVHNKGVPCEAMVAHEFLNLIKAADVPVDNGQNYADAGRIASNKVRRVIERAETVKALVDAAKDAMAYVKTDSLAKLDLSGSDYRTVQAMISDLDRAKRAIVKAHDALSK